MKKNKRFLKWRIYATLSVLLIIVSCNVLVYMNARSKTFSTPEAVPKRKVGFHWVPINTCKMGGSILITSTG